MLAAILNTNLESVVIYDGFTYASIARRAAAAGGAGLAAVARCRGPRARRPRPDAGQGHQAIRPELDIFLLADRKPDAMVSDPAADGLRRVFYEVEEPLEIHLSILSGVAERYETPFFDNLKKYAQKPVGTFHALPIARGKSIFRSNWIRDMGEFYGANLFLAESSATTGGLDSLLEPTGNIKKAQDAAARAFGADHVFFVTNGTSTSNKMVHQALLEPGDIVIVDRNCHKSHHYGMVLAGRAAVLRRGVPAGRVLDVRRGAAAQHQEGAARPQGRRPARQGQDGHAHQLHVRRARLRHAPRDGGVPGDQARPDLPVGRGLVRLRALLAALSPAHGDGRARRPQGGVRRSGVPRALPGAGEDSSARTSTRRTSACSTRGSSPIRARPSCASTRRTRRTSRCRRCARARWCWSATRTSTAHEQAFKEAVFTHASTSPNLQIIASLDVARRQMELEGYELVMRAIQLALEIRARSTRIRWSRSTSACSTPREMIPAEFRQSGLTSYTEQAPPGRMPPRRSARTSSSSIRRA